MLAIALVAQLVTAEIDPPISLSPAARTCIEQYAPGVEQVFDSLKDGAEFLVQKVCAAPIAVQRDALYKKEAAEHKAKITESCKGADPATSPWCAPGMDYYADAYAGGGYVMMSGLYSPEADSLAAQALLDLRLKRVAKKR